MKNLFCLFILALSMSVNAQVAINTDGSLPDNSAMLDVKSNAKGILLPRMTLAQRNAITSPAVGLMIYQTDNTPGYYYNSGTSAIPAWVISGTGSGWGFTGNSGTTSGINFIGTTDNVPLTFKVNNQLAGKIDQFTENTSLGYQSLNANTSGSFNTSLGSHSLFSNLTGSRNTAIGQSTLSSNTTGTDNTAIGSGALSYNTTGNENTAVGNISLYFNTTGSYNTAMGKHALMSNSGGNSNTAIGYTALIYNSTGSSNTATGSSALYGNSSGYFNTANGSQALSGNTTGYRNTATGGLALTHNSAGVENTATGYGAMYFNTTGSYNTAYGMEALYSNTIGIYNTATGRSALILNSSGSYNTANGYYSLYFNTYGSYNTATGQSALGYNNTGNYNTAIGNNALVNNTEGFQNTSLGSGSLVNNITGAYHTAAGFNSGPNANGLYNTTCIGTDATATGTDMVRLGNIFVNSIGGQVGWTTLSDMRFKENVKEDVPGLAFITQLRPVTYQLNREKINDFTGVTERHNQSREKAPAMQFQTGEKYTQLTTGFIAQEVEASAKKIGYDFSGVDAPKNEKDMYGLRYAEFVVPLVKAVQELAKQNAELLKRIEELERNNLK
jgi:trimeric autotransporter adhesin